MFIDFEKWHGCKNDFLVTWISATDKDLILPSLQRQAPDICDRSGAGVSADGILVLITKTSRELYPEELVIINSDGSLAKNCGNGLRCAARSVLRKIAASGAQKNELPPVIELKVSGRIFYCKVFGTKEFIGVDMGQTNVTRIDPSHRAFDTIQSALKKISPDAIQEPQRSAVIYRVSVGNPHLVLLGYKITPPDLDRLARQLQDVDFGDDATNTDKSDTGINVHAAWPGDPHNKSMASAARNMGIQSGEVWQVAPWERGVGLTQACGSGAVATVSAIIADDDMGEPEDWTGITMPGGHLFVSVKESNYTLAGPATLVFTGVLEI